MTAKGNLFVIAAPSGTGKTTLVKAVIDSTPQITVSISHTTRPMRPGEQHGVNYYFITREEFRQLVEHNDFLEHAVIFDHCYGTSKSWVEQTLSQGIDVILEIDWQGHQQIKKLFPESIGIFILPPSYEVLRERLIKRNQDHPDIIKKRLTDMRETIGHIKEFDYLVVNDDFAQAQLDLKMIIGAARLETSLQINKMAELIRTLAS